MYFLKILIFKSAFEKFQALGLCKGSRSPKVMENLKFHNGP